MSASAPTLLGVSGLPTLAVSRDRPLGGVTAYTNDSVEPLVPAAVDAVRRKLAAQCQDLDPGEIAPTRPASRAWQQVLWGLLARWRDVPAPSISIPGDGAACLEWGRGTRSAFLIVEPNGATRLRRLDVADRGAQMSDPISDPQGRDLVDAIAWATGR